MEPADLVAAARSGRLLDDDPLSAESAAGGVARALSDAATGVQAPTPAYEFPPEESGADVGGAGEDRPSAAPTAGDAAGAEYDGEHGAVAARRDWFEAPRRHPDGEIRQHEVRQAALDVRELERFEGLAAPAAAELGAVPNAPSTRWRLTGPGNFSGRVNAIAIDRANRSRLYVCTSSGGAWRSTNGGSTWVEMSAGVDTNFTGAVTVDPNSSWRIYLGTGDPDIWRAGTGLYRSTNGGVSFTATGLTNVDWISDVHVRQGDWRVVVVSTDRGVYRSTDGAASFTRTFVGRVDDLRVNPSGQDEMWIAVRGRGVFHSTDGGASWTRDAGPDPGVDGDGAPIAYGRVRIALCDRYPGELYASFDVGGAVRMWRRRGSTGAWSELPDPPQAGWNQLWYNHYVQVDPHYPDVVYSGQGTIYRSYYGGRRLRGGATSWTEINGATSGGYVRIHVDHHCLTPDPVSTATVYAGCDGGIYRSRTRGGNWSYIGATIPSSEFYAMGQGVAEHYQIGGGTQDNGTWQTDGSFNRWDHILGGDGFEFLVDPTNPNRVYAETQRLRVYRSDNKGASFATKLSGIHPGDVRPWFAKLALAPRTPSVLYVGSDKVYRTGNRADSWSATSCGDAVALVSDRATDTTASPAVTSRVRVMASSTAAAALGLAGSDVTAGQGGYARVVTGVRQPYALSHGAFLDLRVDNGGQRRVVFRSSDFADIANATAAEVAAVVDGAVSGLTANASAGAGITALTVAPATSAAVYAASRQRLYRSVNSGGTWSTLGTGLPNRWITDIAVTGRRWYRLALTVSGTGAPHVWYSGNGGVSWVARSNGLPDAPASTIVIDPDNENRWWVGTDVGVFVTTNAGVSWSPMNTGLPRVVVTDLSLHRTTGLLRAATYGRGIWERQATDPRIWFRGLRTASAGVSDRRTFRRTVDALALTLDLSATPDLVNLGLTYDAMYQVLDPRTNLPVRTDWSRNLRFVHGTGWWISLGRNWGEASGWTTPARWGLGPGLWRFRATVAVNGAETFDTAEDIVFEVV